MKLVMVLNQRSQIEISRLAPAGIYWYGATGVRGMPGKAVLMRQPGSPSSWAYSYK